MKKAYVVMLEWGAYEDHIEIVKFVTGSERLAKDWCERFNHIIADNRERIRQTWRERQQKCCLYNLADDNAFAFYIQTKTK